MTVVETPSFLRRAKNLLTEEERLNLVTYLAENPEAGDVMEGTGGVRKVRWARQGAGKSGGYRIIYYFHSRNIPLFALLIYGKNEKANLSQAEKNEMRKLTAILANYGRARA
ncbi:MAG: type II toxin-antitoxin system RelE/ParE family toxin [Desulfovibrionaceae bacterium]|nr:type II toxin-antitoxin system RelE/ParE family toxin [Desulfovibrionaceae bacterium]